jgi:hypothetical protein
VQRFYAEPLGLVSEKDECMICCRRWANVMSFICLLLIVHTAPTTTAQLTRNTGIIWISINIRQAMSEEKNKEIRICWLKGKEQKKNQRKPGIILVVTVFPTLALTYLLNISRLDTDDLTPTNERVKLGALLKLVLHTLTPSLVCPRTSFMALQPVAVVLVRDAIVNDSADASENSAAIAAFGDIAAVAAAHPVGCASGHLGSAWWDFAESVGLELRVPVVEACDHGDGGSEGGGVGEDVGEEHCRGVVGVGLLVESVVSC